jgi:hypothetical protein
VVRTAGGRLPRLGDFVGDGPVDHSVAGLDIAIKSVVASAAAHAYDPPTQLLQRDGSDGHPEPFLKAVQPVGWPARGTASFGGESDVVAADPAVGFAEGLGKTALLRIVYSMVLGISPRRACFPLVG